MPIAMLNPKIQTPGEVSAFTGESKIMHNTTCAAHMDKAKIK